MTIKNCYKDNCIKVKHDTLSNCLNTPAQSNSISSGVISDIPILLAKQVVEFYSSSLIRLPEKASSINSIDNKIIITDCKLLNGTNVLFIKGFVRKSIYYSSSNISKHKKETGTSRHCLACIPFSCTTNIDLNDSENYKQNTELVFNNGDDKLLGTPSSHFNKISEEHFNKKIFCELVKSIIIEQCKYIYEETYLIPFKNMDIAKITDLDNNMSIRLEIEVLQNQDIFIKPSCIDKACSHPNDYEVNLSTENNLARELTEDNNPICIDNEDNPSDTLDNDSSTSSSLTSSEFLLMALQILVINSLNPNYIYEIFENNSL